MLSAASWIRRWPCASPWNNCSRDRCQLLSAEKPGTGLGHPYAPVLLLATWRRALESSWSLMPPPAPWCSVFMLRLFLLWLVRRDFESGACPSISSA